MRTILILCLSILFLPLTLAAEGDLTVIGGTENTDYSYADNVYTVLTETALNFSGTTTADRIVVKEGVTANITLDNININNTSENTIKLEDGSTLTLTLSKENKLAGGTNKAGINVPANTELIIQGEGELNVTGGRSSHSVVGGAAIGADYKGSIGSILIKNGTITAKALGDYGAAIGSGGEANLSGSLIIEDGNLTLTGKRNEQSVAVSSFNITGGTFINCTLNGEVTIKEGTYTNCRLNNIISFDDTRCTFTKCNISFKNPATLTKDYSECTFNGDITVNSENLNNCTFNNNITVQKGTFTTCTLKDNITINDGTFNQSTIDGTFTINNGTITNKSKLICNPTGVINGGDITISDNGSTAIEVASGKTLTINGGNIDVTGTAPSPGIGTNNERFGNIIINGGYISSHGNGWLAQGIGGSGYGIQCTGNVSIHGGTVLAYGSNGWDLWGIGGTLIISGGTAYIYDNQGGNSHQHTVSDGKNTVYRSILSNVPDNITDVSVDNKPYYISQNFKEKDLKDKLYLYMTGDKEHTIAIRTNDGNVTTYTSTFVENGVEGNKGGKGFFTFSAPSTTTPSGTPTIAFEAKDITATYTKENYELTVTLTVTKISPISRSAAMNSVQLTLTEGTNTYYSDRQTVTGSGEYTFTFDTQGLDAGNYTLTANYGGSTTSLAANEQTKTLTIEKATPTYTIPSNLSVTYGKTLADINLPDGWAWKDDPTTSVGNVSSSPKTFAATFTPADTKNYNTVVENLSITVNKAEASNPENPEVTSPSPVTYGAKLSDITISDGWQWADGTIVPTVYNYYGYWAYYPVTDDTNYDWSGIYDYDGTNHRVKRRVSVTVNKADLSAVDFTFTAPSDLVYNGSAKAVTVTAKSGLTGIGSITIQYYKENVATATDPIEVGNYTVKINVDGGNNYNDITDLEVGKFSIIPKQYAIGIDPAIANGTVTADKTQAAESETVTLTVTPAQGYEQETLSYTTDGGTTETITGTTFVMPAADVTVTATFKASSVPPVNPPVIPDDPDDPAPVRYTVTLPAVEGATTDPAAGSYEVESWGNFSFLLTLGEGYRKDSHPVVTARGETLTPNASTGKYIIPNVQSDITVGISGIVKDVATGNESLTDGFHITTSGGLLLVTVPRATRLYLTDTSGRLILSRLLPAGDTRIDDLAAGVYLLTLEGEKTKKIIIR